MARPDKVGAVAELTEEFRSSNAAVLTEYRGLTVSELKELRRSLGATTTYAVVKNTLTKIAAKDAGVESFNDLLSGPSAIAFIKGDPVEAAKGLRSFAKEHPFLVIKGGVLDGEPLDAKEISRLADLESREVLLARLAGGMVASLSQAASLFQAPLSQAARVVEALRAKAEADPSVLAGGAGTPTAAEPEGSVEEEAAAPVEDRAVDGATTEQAASTEAPAEETAADNPAPESAPATEA